MIHFGDDAFLLLRRRYRNRICLDRSNVHTRSGPTRGLTPSEVGRELLVDVLVFFSSGDGLVEREIDLERLVGCTVLDLRQRFPERFEVVVLVWSARMFRSTRKRIRFFAPAFQRRQMIWNAVSDPDRLKAKNEGVTPLIPGALRIRRWEPVAFDAEEADRRAHRQDESAGHCIAKTVKERRSRRTIARADLRDSTPQSQVPFSEMVFGLLTARDRPQSAPSQPLQTEKRTLHRSREVQPLSA